MERLMHPFFEKANSLTENIIASAIEVHRHFGPGLLESVYEWALTKELELRGHKVESQRQIIVRYKQFSREEVLRFNILVEGCVLIEVKATARILPLNKAQLLSYMKLLDVPLGLLINFHVGLLTQGVSRLILPGANC
jgi:GxxExxY protein